ncbi:MAG: hypothetical protein IJ150_02635 [Bacteroidales bacterium]|nr:hypothetical protein [Bacteroidales bacterium]
MDNNQNYKTFVVAIASSDGYNIDVHFGRAETFYIYRFFIDEWIFIEKRELKPVCQNGKHSISQMQESVKIFSDCKYIAASKIGAGASSTIRALGIIPIELPGDINEALEKIFSYEEIQNLFIN